MCVLAKGDTAVFTYTYKPEESTDHQLLYGGGYSTQVINLTAWSDPDGDGVYVKRSMNENYDYEDNYSDGQNGYADLLPGNKYEVLPVGSAWTGNSWSASVNRDEEGRHEVRLSADRVLELFGPNTLVGFSARGIYTSDPTDMDWFILVEGNTPQPITPPQPEKPAGVKTANPTNDKLMVNGAEKAPTVYKIGGSNYFKIRDVAAVLNGTEKQFAVGYSGGKVTVSSGQPYEATGKELAGAPDSDRDAAPSNDSILIDGEEASLTVYKIGGSNYFKLRDLGKALDFYVGYTGGKVTIETGKSYDK